MFCSNCGNKLDDNTGTCPVCNKQPPYDVVPDYTRPETLYYTPASSQKKGSKLTCCKTCGAEIAKNAKRCPACGAKNKKPLLKRWWFWILVIIVLLSAFSRGDDTPTNEAPAQSNPAISSSIKSDDMEGTEDENGTALTTPEKTTYSVGDTLQDGSMKIVYISSGEYIEENEFLQPEEGYKYIFLKFYFENVSDRFDDSISVYNFTCYADGYAADMYYSGNESLSASLSGGRGTTGYVYFMVPQNAIDIEIEYETNFFTEDKITFVYNGEEDSGYEPVLNAIATEDAYAVGETAESSNLRITYLSCEETTSDNMFIQPADGYRFITCEFEFENLGSGDEYVSSFDFDCYADGFYCTQNFFLENDLGAELSSGRKTSGTVTFEVPVDASIIELEYLSNYWTSSRVVFTVN